MARQLELPEDEADALVQPGECRVLGRDVLPGGGSVGQPVRDQHLEMSVEK